MTFKREDTVKRISNGDIGVIVSKVRGKEIHNVKFGNEILSIDDNDLEKFCVPSFDLGDSAIIINGKYKGMTGCVSKVRNGWSIENTHLYKVFLDIPLTDDNGEMSFFVTVNDYNLQPYNERLEKSYCCYRDGAQESLRYRLEVFLEETKITQHKIAEDINIEYRILNNYKNDIGTMNENGRPYRYLYLKPFYLLKKYLEEHGY